MGLVPEAEVKCMSQIPPKSLPPKMVIERGHQGHCFSIGVLMVKKDAASYKSQGKHEGTNNYVQSLRIFN